jgi:hypothetical protein
MPALLAVVTGVLGYALLLVAAMVPWFRLPELRVIDGAATIVGTEPRVAIAFKALCLIASGAAWLARHDRARLARVLVLLLVALSFFPYFVMVWSPDAAARASWLQTQHESMSWLGGDIYGEQEIKDIDFKNRVEVADAEMPVAAFHLPDWTPATMQWSRLPEIVEWLGFSNRFCQFVNKGWFVALAGALFAMVPLCRGARGFRFEVCETIAKTGFVAFSASSLLALTPLFVTGYCISFARDAAQGGDPAGSLKWLQRAGQVLPAIEQDSDFVAQRGLLESRLGLNTPAATLHAAAVLDRQGFTVRARDAFDSLLATAPADSAVYREAGSALLRSSIRALNSGKATSAAETLDCVLAHDPCNVKALYTQQLACLRTSHLERLPSLLARLDGVYRFFSTKTKAPVIAASYENGALAEYLRAHTDEALALRRISMGRPR